MAVRFKFSANRGDRANAMTVGAGDTVGTDTMALNFDVTNMTERDAIELLDQAKRKIMETPWPPL